MRRIKTEKLETIENMSTKFRNKHYAKLLGININGVREDAWNGTLSRKHKCRKHGKVKHVWCTKVVGPSLNEVMLIAAPGLNSQDNSSPLQYTTGKSLTSIFVDLASQGKYIS